MNSSKRVLLVDDHPGFASQQRALFDGRFDACSSVEQLESLVREGVTWDVAFVDFELGPGQRGGLGVLKLLTEYRAAERPIVFTTLAAGGRMLFAAAAREWFGIHGVLDKADGDDATLVRTVETGWDPTAPARQDALATESVRINRLFADPRWLTYWRLWPEVLGSRPAALARLTTPHTPTSLREFSDGATDACEHFQAALIGGSPLSRPGKNTARAVPLAAFANRHREFFLDPDLPAVLDDVLPWKRCRI